METWAQGGPIRVHEGGRGNMAEDQVRKMPLSLVLRGLLHLFSPLVLAGLALWSSPLVLAGLALGPTLL